ncbi:MAG TPA: phage Gp37/Gp68 family protein [Dehalococcoidia bacterium]|nr:phage Gp37/Gp68 family protein [Dehalococcoidia bacterium]
MSDKSGIQWCDATWTVVTGCTKISPACAYCYIQNTPPFRKEGRRFEKGHIPVRLHPERLDWPLKWRKPRRIFVTSLGDLFHEDIDDKFISKVFAMMDLTRQHTYQVLTKRADRMRELLNDENFQFHVGWFKSQAVREFGLSEVEIHPWPLRNVWLGVSVENQCMADERIPLLLQTPAAVRFLSCEPLLGLLDLRRICRDERNVLGWNALSGDIACDSITTQRIDWVIAGGESGGPEQRRLVEQRSECVSYDRMDGSRYQQIWKPKPQALEWARSLRDQCVAAGVPFFFKQWGGPTPKSGGRLLDGRTWDEFPAK